MISFLIFGFVPIAAAVAPCTTRSSEQTQNLCNIKCAAQQKNTNLPWTPHLKSKCTSQMSAIEAVASEVLYTPAKIFSCTGALVFALGENTMEQVSLIGTAIDIMSQNLEKIDQCNNDPTCKKAWSEEIIELEFGSGPVPPGVDYSNMDAATLFEKISRAKSKNYTNCGMLDFEFVQQVGLHGGQLSDPDIMKQRIDYLREKGKGRCPEPRFMKTPPGLGDIIRSVDAWMTEIGIALECYDPATREALFCYGIGKVFAQPGPLAAGALSAAAKKLVKTGIKKSLSGSKVATPQARTDVNLRRWVDKYASQTQNLTNETEREIFKLGAHRAEDLSENHFYSSNMNFIKSVSDASNSPAVADAMRNRFLEIQAAKRAVLAKKYGISTKDYTSFKTGALSSNAKTNFDRFTDELRSETRKDFIADPNIVAFAKKYNLDLEKLATSGRGPTYAEADLAAKKMRTMQDSSQVGDWQSPKFQAAFKQDLITIDKARASLAAKSHLRNSNLMTSIPDSQFGGRVSIPSVRTFEILRKNKGDIGRIRKELNDKLGVNDITDAEIRSLQTYSDGLDTFAINTLKVDQSTLRVHNSANGVATVDFPGVAALEKRVLAEKIHNTHRNLDDAVQASVEADHTVTAILDGMREYVKQRANAIAPGTKTRMNGDDGITEFISPLNHQQKVQYLKDIGHDAYMGPPRVSFTQPGLKDVALAETLNKQGHSLEKMLRSELSGKIPEEKLKQIIFATDMEKNATGLYVSKMKEVDILESEQALIKDSFKKVVSDFNDNPSNRARFNVSEFFGLEP